jgi:shikimate kinase
MKLIKQSSIILIGMMGSGKTSVGKLLSEFLDYDFMETDLAIEIAENNSISSIFDTKGENYFRELEANIISQIPLHDTIVATGGGLPVFNENMDTLLGMGVLVYLKASPEQIFNRLENSHNRPLFQNDMVEVNQLLKIRSKFYEKAHHVIDVSDKTLHEICDEIKQKLNL